MTDKVLVFIDNFLDYYYADRSALDDRGESRLEDLVDQAERLFTDLKRQQKAGG